MYRANRREIAIIAICYEFSKYVQQLLVLAECNSPLYAIGDELRKYVLPMLFASECNTTLYAIGDELLTNVLQLPITAITVS